jgi:glycosyltransferase involved in cell wall biosynthesis
VPDIWLPAFSLVDEVWAASRFIQDGLKGKSPVPVTLIPPVVHLQNTGTLSRRRLSLPEQRFLFLAMGDASSVMERKNPRAAVRAFKKAFRKSDSRVGLVLKVRDRNPFRSDMSILRREIVEWPNIYLLEQSLNRQEINSLISVTDCFVSLHRSEGFGLVPAEAMSLGKPVIMTQWSGNVDYMTPDNSIGISFELVKLERDYGPYKAGQVWAEPDIEEAAHWMEKVAGDPDLARAVGKRGQQTIQDDFSPRVVGDLIQKRLAQIKEQYR